MGDIGKNRLGRARGKTVLLSMQRDEMALAFGGAVARILLVEDERPVRAMLRRVLTGAGHDVADTAHSETAYSQVSGHDVDLVMSDVMLPGQGGIALLLALRRSFPSLPLVAIAGKDREDIHAQLDVAGLRHRVWLLTKPFTCDELLATVKAALPAVPDTSL